MKIYIDVLFLTNFIMNYVLFVITSEIMSSKLKHIRSVISSALGSAAGILFFMLDLKNTGLFLLVSAILMNAAVFCPCKPKIFLKYVLVFFLSAAVASGTIYTNMRFFGGGIIKNGILYASSPTIGLSALLLPIAAKLLFSKLKRRASQKKSSIILEYKGKKISLNGFTDTGNGLFDPISKKPVMIIEENILKKLVADECNAANLCEWVESERIKIIPYNTVNSEGCFTAIVLDCVYIENKRITGAIAAVCEKKLKYPVILNAGM